jgi:hypothetical protein
MQSRLPRLTPVRITLGNGAIKTGQVLADRGDGTLIVEYRLLDGKPNDYMTKRVKRSQLEVVL